MAYVDAHAPRRTQKTCAKKGLISIVKARFVRWWTARDHPAVPHMNTHIARDIGLTETDLARMQHQWPSQTMHHPRC